MGKREFTWVEGLAFCLAAVGMQIAGELITGPWSLYFYSPTEDTGRTIYVSVGLMGVVFIIGSVWDALTDPLVGIWSDRTSTQPGKWRIIPLRGRRRPFIFWGGVLMTTTSIAFWYPPVPHTSVANFLYVVIILCLHWLFFTICTVPFNALGPEIARSQQARVKLGVWFSVGMILGLALSNIIPGFAIDALAADTAANASQVEEAAAQAIGYKRMAIIFTFGFVMLMMFTVWAVRERYDSAKVERESSSMNELKAVMSNRAFQLYLVAFLLFMSGYLAVQTALPYWVELCLDAENVEVTTSVLLMPFIGSALLAQPVMPFISKRLPVKWMLFLTFLIIATGLPLMYPIGVSALSTQTKIILGGLLFAYVGFGQGMMYVIMTPLMGEIIDLDEKSSGHRREAAYNGVSGVAWKAAYTIRMGIATQALALLGNTQENPLGALMIGPVAGVLGVLGLIVVWFYPVLDVAKAPGEVEAPPEVPGAHS